MGQLWRITHTPTRRTDVARDHPWSPQSGDPRLACVQGGRGCHTQQSLNDMDRDLRMSIVSISAWVMTMAGGIFTGGVFFVAVERINLWRRMPVEQYAVDFRRSLRRADPLLPILGVTSAIASVVHAVHSSGASSAASWISAALIGAVIVTSIAIGEPINSAFRRLPEGQVPEDVEQLRINWRRFHLFRTFLVLLAFACIAVSAV